MVSKIIAVRMLGNRDMFVSSVGTIVSRMLGITATAVNLKNSMRVWSSRVDHSPNQYPCMAPLGSDRWNSGATRSTLACHSDVDILCVLRPSWYRVEVSLI